MNLIDFFVIFWQDESDASDSEDESAELEMKLREKALQSMQRRQKQSSVSSSD